jgi:hypothetical protein
MRLAGGALAGLLTMAALACAPPGSVDRWAPRSGVRIRPDAGVLADGAPAVGGGGAELGAAAPGGTDGAATLDLGPADAAGGIAAEGPAPGLDARGAIDPDAAVRVDAAAGPDAPADSNVAPTPVDAATEAGGSPCLPGGCKRVFVSSQTMPNGGLGSVARADATCAQLAATAGLEGVWRVWLSDARTSPALRFTRSSRPYLLLDGTQVAASWAALTSGTLEHAIDVFETGVAAPPGASLQVWTGTTPAGSASGVTCGNWTNNSPGLPSGEVGLSDRRDGRWTQAVAQLCSQPGVHIYCFEQ